MKANQLFGQYYVQHEDTTLIADLSHSDPKLWLKTQWESFQLLPVISESGTQLRLSLGSPCNIDLLAQQFEPIFYRTLTAIAPFHDGQRELLDFCLSFGLSAVELTEKSPAFAYLAAFDHYFLKRMHNKTATINPSRQKRINIIADNQFPAEKWVVKLLQKIPAQECRGSLFHDLRGILLAPDQKQLKTLQHLKQLNHLTVTILTDKKFSELFHRTFLDTLSTLNPEHPDVDIFWQLYAVKEDLINAVSQDLKVTTVRRYDHLHRIHDDLVGWLNDRSFLSNIDDLIFAKPPVKGIVILDVSNKNYGIYPITTGKELWHEGQTMCHCIAGFAQEILKAKGKLYPYHVDLPGEPAATLLIAKESPGWVVQEIRGYRNELPTHKVRSFVYRWLKDNNMSLKNDCQVPPLDHNDDSD